MINNLDITDFLANYWQKKPLIIRSAFPNYQSPISAEELAGLACEDFVESRIISENKTAPNWSLENGPFPESHFTKLPETHWTLLIQGLNKIFPEFDDLLHKFNFIPSWRVDDLMASYAAPGGSVGPHIDQYDVFLLQASGRRKWMISEKPVADDNFEKDLPLKIIKHFTAESEWIVEAGDILYLPPNVSHYGVALDSEENDEEECITFSIGFRAPSHADLLTSFIDQYVSELTDENRYNDPTMVATEHAGEISEAAINKIQEILISQINNKDKVKSWFGRYITDYLQDEDEFEINELKLDEFITAFINNGVLRRPANVRANYIKEDNSNISLYINGQHYPTESETTNIATLFCNQHLLQYEAVKTFIETEKSSQLLCDLFNTGYLQFDENE